MALTGFVGWRLLGTGFSASVYEASRQGTQDAPATPVAIKVFRKDYRRSQIHRETALLQTVQGHPNIVRLHGAYAGSDDGEEPSPCALVMDFHPGEDLFSYVERRPCTEPEA